MAARRAKTRSAGKTATARKQTTARKKATARKQVPTKKKAVKKKVAAKKKVAPRKKTATTKSGAAGKKAVKKGKSAKAKKARARTPEASPATMEVASDDRVVEELVTEAGRIRKVLLRGERPEITTPQRSLKNVTLSKDKGYFQIGRKRLVRTLSVNTVRTFAQTLKFMALSKEMVLIDDLASKREVYYQSINWGDARFNDQSESDTVMDDVEAMFSIHGVSREQLRFIPEEHGGAVAGNLTVIDRDPETGDDVRIDCRSLGSGSYTVPSLVEGLRFESNAKFILAVETGGMYQRLTYHRWWKATQSIIVNLGGVPSRATRRFLRRLSDEQRLPVYVFTDCDPYGFANIYRTLKVGSGNAAHINRFYCVPRARLIGVTPQDILDYKLPTHPLKDVDVKRAKAALKNDPFFQAWPQWMRALKQQITMGVRAEQQAFAKHHLNFVMDTYLPEKLSQPKKMLP